MMIRVGFVVVNDVHEKVFRVGFVEENDEYH